ncbi:cell division ATP-binding protein FtsE [Alkalicoccus halolimnae]|uniref:ATP-binding cassette domain-containing protein n=1 Tax=Alkalicoccus halolimnae TaxID=1667239 RepID=A0A5C7FBZ5_9BACI|nr:ATP-binding cassette domain-containing protein [Alkalicoccus halolimnae]TXF84341.1 ATP-binding cassette domain-containing protein [Alkalicoccus halolimnae]
MIELKNVWKAYRSGVMAVNNVSLHVRQGEFVYITGNSGAGKSSIMKILYLDAAAFQGEVLVCGENLQEMSGIEQTYYRRRLGIIFQDACLLPNRSVMENTALPAKILGENKRTRMKKAREALEITGLSEKRFCLPCELSGGEMKKAALARAIVNNPEIILADEPMANLDKASAEKVLMILEEMNRRGTTVIVTTHTKEFIPKVNNREVVIENGRIISDGRNGGRSREA